jgi:hypothetical protein
MVGVRQRGLALVDHQVVEIGDDFDHWVLDGDVVNEAQDQVHDHYAHLYHCPSPSRRCRLPLARALAPNARRTVPFGTAHETLRDLEK